MNKKKASLSSSTRTNRVRKTRSRATIAARWTGTRSGWTSTILNWTTKFTPCKDGSGEGRWWGRFSFCEEASVSVKKVQSLWRSLSLCEEGSVLVNTQFLSKEKSYLTGIQFSTRPRFGLVWKQWLSFHEVIVRQSHTHTCRKLNWLNLNRFRF